MTNKWGVRGEGNPKRCGGSSGKMCFENGRELCAGAEILKDGMGVCLDFMLRIHTVCAVVLRAEVALLYMGHGTVSKIQGMVARRIAQVAYACHRNMLVPPPSLRLQLRLNPRLHPKRLRK